MWWKRGEADGSGDREGLGWRARLVVATASRWQAYRRRREGSAEIRNILVSRRTRLGDLIVVLPMLRALRRGFPRARIVLGLQSDALARSILADSADVDEIRVIDPSGSSSWQRVRAVFALQRDRFDVLITGEPFSLIPEALFCGAPIQVGFEGDHPLQRYNNHRVRFDPSIPAADNHLALLEPLGVRVEDSERAPRLAQGGNDPTPPPAHGQDPILILHPGSQRPSRRWPAERFAELAAGLVERWPDHRVLFSGVEEEAALIESIRNALDPATRSRTASLVGALDLAGFVQLLKRARLFVSNDTGVMHLARSLGVPLVALLGPENDDLWGPHPAGWGPAISLRHEVPCAPCQRWECNRHYCLRQLQVAEVMAAATELLDERETRQRGEEGQTQDSRHLERRSWRHSWSALRQAGFELPTLTLVELHPRVAGPLLRWSTDHCGPIERAVDGDVALAESAFPVHQRVLVLPPHAPVPDAATADAVVRVSPRSPAAAWLAILDAANGEFIAPRGMGALGFRPRHGADLARLLSQTGLAARCSSSGVPRLLRRSAIEEQLRPVSPAATPPTWPRDSEAA